MTLLELIIACAILAILSAMAIPVFKYTVIRQKEGELRSDLQTMRDAIDRYKLLADQHKFRTEVGTDNYPPDLETMVKGIQFAPGDDRRLVFLRRIPVDPMTGRADWGLRCTSDEPDSKTWCGKNVFDVYSKSDKAGLNGTKYGDW